MTERLPLVERDLPRRARLSLAAARVLKSGGYLACGRNDTRYQRLRWYMARAGAGVLGSNGVELGVITRHVRAGDLVLDIGASYGVYTRALSGMVGPRGDVHAFEPQPSIAQMLSQRSAANVTVVQAALAREPGAGHLVTPALPGGAPETTRAHVAADPEPRSVPVDFITLDRHCESLRRVSFVKIDAEGHDVDVLEGGQRTLAADRPLVQVEHEENLDALRPLLESLGYWAAAPYEGRLVPADDAGKRGPNVFLVPDERRTTT